MLSKILLRHFCTKANRVFQQNLCVSSYSGRVEVVVKVDVLAEVDHQGIFRCPLFSFLLWLVILYMMKNKNKNTCNMLHQVTSSRSVVICVSSRLCVGLKSQYPGPTHVAMVRGLKYEYSLGLSDSCRHMVVMSPSPIGITPLHRHFSSL